MFDWLGDILAGLGDAIAIAFDKTVGEMVDAIWTALVQWLYSAIFNAVADLFTGINHMGAEIFSLSWVGAVVDLFTLFGWTLFAAGVAVAVFDIAIEAQSGRASVKSAALNILKGFFACSLVGVVPVELYQFCVSLQNTFAGDLTGIFAGTQTGSFGDFVLEVLRITLDPANVSPGALELLLILIAFSYCVVKVFFAVRPYGRTGIAC